MAFRFKTASCVVAGTFNIYVVQPPWLTKIGVFPMGTKIVISAKFDGPGFRYLPENSGMKWSVNPAWIEVETTLPNDDCGSSLKIILEKLPWTPLTAIGNNAVYEAPLSELEGLPVFDQFDPAMPNGSELTQRTLHLAIRQGEQEFNIQLSVRGEIVELTLNVNTDLAQKDSDYAQRLAQSFFDHRRQSELLAKQLLKVSISHADGNPE